MSSVVYQDQVIELNQGESVLDGLLRSGIEHPYGCKSGSCQSCMLKRLEGELPAQSQQGLTPAQQNLGFFLACQCKPRGEIVVSQGREDIERVAAQVDSIEHLNDQVLRLRLKSELQFIPGQYIRLWKNDSESRCYSIANLLNAQGIIELHIKKIPGGVFSGWLGAELSVGDAVAVSGPLGECFYTLEREKPLLLAGIGTGLAPLIGIALHALSVAHEAPIHLIAAAKTSSQLYLQEELDALAGKHNNFQYTFLAQQVDNESANVAEGDVYGFVKERFPSTKNYRVFLCGADSFVRKMKKQVFLAGANMQDISADAFLPSG